MLLAKPSKIERTGIVIVVRLRAGMTTYLAWKGGHKTLRLGALYHAVSSLHLSRDFLVVLHPW